MHVETQEGKNITQKYHYWKYT